MIYLFDEKRGRRYDYGWSDEKIASFRNEIRLFDSYAFLDDESMLSGKCDVVFRHESFFDGVPRDKGKKAKDIVFRIDEACKQGKLKQVVFSGSKMSRKIDGDTAFMPVSALYQNLDFFLRKYHEGEWTLADIVYGKNTIMEQKILVNIREINILIVEEDKSFSWPYENLPQTLFVKNISPKLDKPSFFKTDECGIYYDLKADEPISDLFLHEFVVRELVGKKYDKLFIPLCFGPTLSDYNGLRLALHIRTTEGKNQFSPIYIYSPVNVSDLINDEYFDILKTSNVFLINYSCQSLYDSLLQSDNTNEEDVRRSLSKIHLQPPKNYADNHSIANEWAIYRWTKTIGKDVEDETINNIIKNIEHNLYFKYLRTIYPPREAEQLEDIDLMIKGITKEMNGEYLDEPSILFVDDEAERGWFKLFKTIIQKNNPNIFVKDLGRDSFAGKSQDDIVSLICDKVKSDDFNIVILDFRLHPDDFSAEKVEDVTGYKALCKIKESNPGIQVIILSATNKVWNLQELQNKDANGFILKESPNNSKDESFTIKTINSFVRTISNAVNNRYKKTFYEKCNVILSNLNRLDLTSRTEEYAECINTFIKQIQLLKDNIKMINYATNKSSLDIAYVNCYYIFEKINDNYFENGVMYIIEKVKNTYQWRISTNFKKTVFSSVGSLIITIESNRKDVCRLIGILSSLIDYRTAFIHGKPFKKKHFEVSELLEMLDFCEELSKKIKPW